MVAAARDRLLGWYRRYIGEPDADSDVYLGFGLFFGGIGFGLVGLAVFLWSAALDPGTPADPNMVFWALRETAIALGLVGLPALLSAIVVLLPVERRVRWTAAAGAAVTLAATAAFVAVYPFEFNVQGAPDYAPQVVAGYAVGLVALVGATGAALVGHHLDRAAPSEAAGTGAGAGTASEGGAGAAGGSAEVSEERVERDIEEAMDGAELTWGGVEADDTRQLTVETDTGDAEVEAEGLDPSGANTTTVSAGDTEAAVDGLRQLRGEQRSEARSAGIDEQAAALQELREQQEAAEGSTTPADRLKSLFGFD